MCEKKATIDPFRNMVLARHLEAVAGCCEHKRFDVIEYKDKTEYTKQLCQKCGALLGERWVTPTYTMVYDYLKKRTVVEF